MKLLRRIIEAAIVTASLLSGSANGQNYAVRTKTCKILSCVINAGSAVCIGESAPGHWIFVCSGHQLRETQNLEVAVAGKWRKAVFLGRRQDAETDLGLFGLRYAGELRWAEVADSPAEVGDPVIVCGFVEGRRFRRRTGQVIAHNYRAIDLVVDTPVTNGESGGGIFLASNEKLVGIISASDGRHCLATGLPRIREFVDSRLGGIPGSTIPREERRLPHESEQDREEPAENPADLQDRILAETERRADERAASLQQQLDAIREALSSVSSGKAELGDESRPPQNIETEPKNGFGISSLPWETIAAALGIGGPVGAGIAVGGWLLRRRVRRRNKRNKRAKRRDGPEVPSQPFRAGLRTAAC